MEMSTAHDQNTIEHFLRVKCNGIENIRLLALERNRSLRDSNKNPSINSLSSRLIIG